MLIQVLLSPTKEPEAISHLIRLILFSPKVNLQTFNGLHREFQWGGEGGAVKRKIFQSFSVLSRIFD